VARTQINPTRNLELENTLHQIEVATFHTRGIMTFNVVFKETGSVQV